MIIFVCLFALDTSFPEVLEIMKAEKSMNLVCLGWLHINHFYYYYSGFFHNKEHS